MDEPIWVLDFVVLAVHTRELEKHGGASGTRDQDLLASALARPQQLFAYGTPDLCDLAAAYTAGIVENHPFVDGNKRTGFEVGILFLERNGRRFNASPAEATKAVLGLASGDMKQDEYAAWL